MKTLRHAFVKSTKARVDEWEARLTALKARVRESTGEQKTRLDEQLDELSMRQGSARQYLWELSSKPGTEWQPVEVATLEKWSDFSGSVEAMWDRVS